MFPFNDTFLATFNGTLLPSQSRSGEITAMEFNDLGASETTKTQLVESTSKGVVTENPSQTLTPLQKTLPTIDKNGESNMKLSINNHIAKSEPSTLIKIKTNDDN
ncbi:hypothetical protein CAEBREN_17106 [Caenorhabditis brenneri]|uniref:Uncharacterized protein n=1 Tax=Caenorhabditis brenneri TaxID=135651 RepID=G0MHT7_CAEBE|nr:hypothetical protein CAEBREN_17106 [Caenorhabditis brenneri]